MAWRTGVIRTVSHKPNATIIVYSLLYRSFGVRGHDFWFSKSFDSLLLNLLGFLMVSQTIAHRIVALTLSVLATSVSAQDSPKAPLYPIDVAVAGDTQYVADRNLPGIWQVKEGKVSVYFQAEKKFRTPLNAVRCLAIDKQGRLLAGDSSGCNVYRFDKEGKPTAVSKQRIGIPMALAVDSTGRILVADIESHQIFALPAEGGDPKVVAKVQAPRGLAIDDDDQLLVVSHGANQLVRVDKEGKVSAVVEGRPFRFPHHVAVDKDGAIYIADGYGKSIWKIGEEKQPSQWVKGEPLDNPVGLAAAGDLIYVADSRAAKLFAIDADAKVTPVIAE